MCAKVLGQGGQAEMRAQQGLGDFKEGGSLGEPRGGSETWGKHRALGIVGAPVGRGVEAPLAAGSWRGSGHGKCIYGRLKKWD